jgi:hypothetical protein
LKKLQTHTDKSDKQITELKNKIEKTEIILCAYAETLYEELDTQIALADKSKSVELRNTLRLRRARLAYLTTFDEETRTKLFLELAPLGNEDDVKSLEKIIENADELQGIKTIAKIVLDELKKRLGLK